MMGKSIAIGEFLAILLVAYWINGTPENSIIAPPSPVLVVLISLALGILLAFPIATMWNGIRSVRNRIHRRRVNANKNEAH